MKNKSKNYQIIDIESCSETDLELIGAYNYWLHPSTKILFIGVKFSDSDKVHINKNPSDYVEVLNLLMCNVDIIAHNYEFEFFAFLYLIRNKKIKGSLAKWFGDASNYICTKATAQRFGIADSKLFNLSYVLKLKNKKLGTGEELIQTYSVPDKKTGLLRPLTDKKAIAEFKLYLKFDILSTEEVYNFLPKLKEDKREWEIFQVDKIINARGVQIDIPTVELLSTAYNNLIEKTRTEAEEKYGLSPSGKALTITSNEAIKSLLDRYGVKVGDAQEITLNREYLKTKNKTVRNIIDLRRILQAKSPKKLSKFIALVDNTNRYRYTLNYYGTQPTGRWSGYGGQLHNLPKIVSKNFEADLAEIVAGKNILVGSMLRGLIIPKPKHSLGVGDLSSIELILNAWFSGCTKILDIIKSGKKLYTEFAKELYNNPKITKDSTEYQLGKIAILGLGYGMGTARFILQCLKYDFDISWDESERTKLVYRKTYPEIANSWYDIEDAVISAMITKVPVTYRSVTIIFSGKTLRITLPSGRTMYYFNPVLVSNPRGGVRIKIGKSYLWGGDFIAHIISGMARDIFASALIKCEQKKLNPVLTIHDEIVCEILDTQLDIKIPIFKNILCHIPAWAPDLPMGADIGIMKRYTKL